MTQYRKLAVIWCNEAGELDREIAFNEQNAADVLRQMVKGHELQDGDTFKIVDLGATG